MARTLYRLELPGGGQIEREGTPEHLAELKTLKQTEGGTIKAFDIKVNAMRNDDVLQTFEQGDDAEAYLEPLRIQAAQNVAGEFYHDTIKTLLDPQPDWLND